MKVIVPEYEFSAEQLHLADDLAKKTGLEKETARLLFARGADSEEKIRRFMHPCKENFLSPFLMRGMQELKSAIDEVKAKGGEVVVFGDYDADGICASSIMHYALRRYGVRARIYVPERTDGYGLSNEGIDKIFKDGVPDLFVTVDCGVSCREEVAYARSLGANVIVTDHHELPEALPDCVVVNPKLPDDYPYDNLCGAGVAFKVACALLGERAYDLLDFAALATVADSVPLLNENRDIVAEGLRLFNENLRPCFAYLLSSSDKYSDETSSQTLAYTLAPRVNAAGRMGDARAAFELFTTEDEEERRNLASRLCAYNTERQKKCDELYESAQRMLSEKGAYSHVVMLKGENWNAGFVGIVAARIAERYNRPTLIFVRHGDMLRGSARSVGNVNIFTALKACSEYIEEFGGHAQAAGVNVKEENFTALEAALDKEIGLHYAREDFLRRIPVVGEATRSFSPKFLRELVALEPYGVGHKKPLFSLNIFGGTAREMKPGSKHLTLKNDKIDLVYFSAAEHRFLLDDDVKKTLVFEVDVHRYKGREYVKGIVRDFVYDGRDKKDASYAALSSALDRYFDVSPALPPCRPVPLSSAEIFALIEEKKGRGEWGLCLLAGDLSVLEKYPCLKDEPCDLFYPSSQDAGNALIACPLPSADLSAYDTVVCLDTPFSFSSRCFAGKTVYYNREVSGTGAFSSLSSDRAALASAFTALKKNESFLQGNSAEALIDRCGTFGQPKGQFLFALRVFEELGILDFSFGAPVINAAVKTELSRSPLYEKVRLLPREESEKNQS